MPNAKPHRNLTPVLCQRLSQEMLKACQDVAARHGLVVEAKEIAVVDLRWGFDLAFRVSDPLPDGTALDPERLRFEALAEAFGLSAADYGCQFSAARETFRLVGIDPKEAEVPHFSRTHPGRAGIQVHGGPSGAAFAVRHAGCDAEGMKATTLFGPERTVGFAITVH